MKPYFAPAPSPGLEIRDTFMALSLQGACQLKMAVSDRQPLFIFGHYATGVAWIPGSALPSWSMTILTLRLQRTLPSATFSNASRP